MRIYTTFFSMILLPVLLVHSILADDFFTMDDINTSLQMEYQSQLILQPQTRHKPQPKKVVVKKHPVKRQPQVQHKVVPAPVYRPAAKVVAPNNEDLFEAATYGNVNLITRLLQQGININAANSERETALHMAAANGRYPAVIYLINHGANIHSRTIKNWMPIHHAARFRKPNIANYLVKKGASPHARTSDGLSAIDMARTAGDQQILRIFGAR